MIVRRAIPSDAAGIASVHVRSWQEGYKGIIPEDFLRAMSVEQRTATWRQTLLKQDSETFVAEEQGNVLGWASVARSRDPDADRTTAELWAIYVDPNAWRQGVGLALWRQAEHDLGSLTFSQVTVWVLKENTEA